MRGGIEPPQGPEHHLKSGVARIPRGKISHGTKEIEASMATRQQRQPVETPTQARQAEPGPSVLALLVASTGLAVLILGVLWFVFFRT
jgi:hypothetical protein